MKSLALVVVLSSTGLAQEPSSAPTRFFVERVAVGAGQFIDLDTGGVFRAARSPSGVRSEIRAGRDGLEFLVERHLDDDPAGAAPDLGDLPWYRVRTDRGRTAWVQVLRAAPAPAVVRVMTRLGGTGPLRPSPGPAFCVGGEGRIAVHFRTHPDYAHYRVERRVGVEGELELAGDVAASPFVDDDATAGERYRYRIVGVTREGDQGIPAGLQGTTTSRGLVEGSCQLGSAGRGFDFLGETVVEGGGDIELTGTYGGKSAASFVDGWGIPIEVAGEKDGRGGGAGANGGWGSTTGQLQIPPGGSFFVPLRGGGVARCRLTMPGDSWTVQLDYSVYPDGEWFPPEPELDVRDEGDRVLVSVDAVPGLVLESVVRHDVLSGDTVALEVADGLAVDRAPPTDTLAMYEVTLVDRHGRALGRSTANLNRLARGVRRGRFRFHYEQAYSLELGRLVDRDAGDVAFASAAGGINSITLAAPGGIANEFLDRRAAEGLHTADLFRALAAASPLGLELEPSANADGRRPATEVFVLRTRHGGWARLAIVGREAGSSWNTSRATVLYAYNPHEPVFDEEVRRRLAVSGVVLDAEKLYGIDFDGFREDDLLTGELDVAVGEGLDFEAGVVATGDEADVVFEPPRGANALTLVRAPTGAATLFLPHFGEVRPNETALFDNLAMVESRALSLATEITLLRDNPAARIVFLRTSDGAWVKLAVSDVPGRDDALRVRWALNPHGPVFLSRPVEAEEGSGFVLDRGGLLGLDPDPHRHGSVREGTVSVRPGEGYSFRDGTIVAAREADLVLARASGDWALVELHVSGGAVPLSTLEEWKGRPRTVEELYDAVVGVRPERIDMEREARLVVHDPASDVFVVRTADGGWAKVMVAARPARDANDPALELSFQYCEGPAAFRPRPSRLVIYGGLLLEPLH